MSASKIDLKALRARALASPDGEAYHPFLALPSVRIGIVARTIEEERVAIFIEVCICSSSENGRGPLRASAISGERMGQCERIGYTLTNEDHRCSTFEKPVTPGRLNEELRSLHAVLDLSQDVG